MSGGDPAIATSRRAFVQLLGATGATAALAGCDRAVDALADLVAPAPAADFRAPEAGEIDLAAHILNRLTWGAAPGEYRRACAIGADAFIEEQLAPASIPDRRCDWLVASIESLAQPTAELYEFDPRQLLIDLSRYKVLRAATSRRQLLEVMVDFWTDHFNIVSAKGDCRWLKAADDRDVVRRHAVGRFRDLLRASALSPAMLIYLDGHDNKVERAGDRPNENYARELLELHTLGVNGGYGQRDVVEVARCLSGWTYVHRPFRFQAARVSFVPSRHDDGEKVVLGVRIPPGGGAADLERVIDVVCAHPSTAQHVATKLCRRLIADAPPPSSAVATAAEAFTRSGGDVAATLRAIFATDEFRSTRGGLFKRPFHFLVSALRATGARTSAAPAVLEYLDRMGQAPFQHPTPEGYPLEAAPWLGTLLWRWNLAFALVGGELPGTSVDEAALTRRVGGTDALAAHLLGRAPRPLEREILSGAASPLAILLASPAFQHC